MAALNGVPTPPSTTIENGLSIPTDLHVYKRKRDEEIIAQSEADIPTRHQQKQQDILAVLQQSDTTPSLLKYMFINDHVLRLSAKKPRLLESATKMVSISSKLQDGAYVSMQHLREDAAHAKQELVESFRKKAKESNSGVISVDGLKQIQRIGALEALMQEVAGTESRTDAVQVNDARPLTNQIKTGAEPGSKIGTVLTLFGNAPTPKQLFSSMQHVSSSRNGTELPIEEMRLPNGLTATKIVATAVSETQKGPTFEEAFPQPYSLPQMHPPKVHKRSSTKDNSLTWEFKDMIGRGSKKNGYTAQSVPVGHWLSYGEKIVSQSPMERRQQRDRALSGERSRAHSDQVSLEDLAKEEEALFRRAYSSFAPSFDNAKALVPEETKSMLWWQKTGQARFDEVFAIDPALLEEVPVPGTIALSSSTGVDSRESDDFASAMDELDGLDEEMLDVKQVHSKTDVDQVLSDIAQLLETLASHQRIRNSSLPPSITASRAPISPAPILNTRLGKPDEPGDDEIATFHSLRRELCYLILQLPPYAVSKLDGQQLATLGVNSLITFQPPNPKGTMEEDQVARLAKYNSIATAAGIATLTRGTSSTTAQHYNTTAQRTPAIGQAANTRYGTLGTPTAAPQYQRTATQQSQYATPGAGVSKYGPSSQYSKYRSTGASQQSSYSQPATQQYYRSQPTPGGYGGYSQQYSQQSTPQQPSYSSQPLAQFQQRSQAAAPHTAPYKIGTQVQGHTPFPRTSSPAKSDYMSQHQLPLVQRPTYSAQGAQYATQQPGSGRATPVHTASQPHTPVNGFSNTPPTQQRTLPHTVAPRPVSTTPQPQQVNGRT